MMQKFLDSLQGNHVNSQYFCESPFFSIFFWSEIKSVSSCKMLSWLLLLLNFSPISSCLPLFLFGLWSFCFLSVSFEGVWYPSSLILFSSISVSDLKANLVSCSGLFSNELEILISGREKTMSWCSFDD